MQVELVGRKRITVVSSAEAGGLSHSSFPPDGRLTCESCSGSRTSGLRPDCIVGAGIVSIAEARVFRPRSVPGLLFGTRECQQCISDLLPTYVPSLTRQKVLKLRRWFSFEMLPQQSSCRSCASRRGCWSRTSRGQSQTPDATPARTLHSRTLALRQSREPAGRVIPTQRSLPRNGCSLGLRWRCSLRRPPGFDT